MKTTEASSKPPPLPSKFGGDTAKARPATREERAAVTQLPETAFVLRLLGPCGTCACRLSDGRCHRFPAVIQHPNHELSAWPKVAETAAGCYEWRAK